MSQVTADGLPEDDCLGLIPTHPCLQRYDSSRKKARKARSKGPSMETPLRPLGLPAPEPAIPRKSQGMRAFPSVQSKVQSAIPWTTP